MPTSLSSSSLHDVQTALQAMMRPQTECCEWYGAGKTCQNLPYVQKFRELAKIEPNSQMQ